jgi:hypothetical protein
MEAKELRIGNYVNWIIPFSNDYSPQKVTLQILNIINNDADICKPIPITEEILLKCGFKKNNIARINSIFNIDLGRNRILTVSDIGTPSGFIYISSIDVDIITDAVIIYNWDYDKTYYLHQLQNLYFALTNEELKINL